MNRAASLASLSAAAIRLDCSPELVRAIWKAETRADLENIYPPAVGIAREWYTPPKFRALKREAVCHAAGFHGVEYLGDHKRAGVSVYYCNAGDAYAPTLCFTGGRLFVACWGDLVESGAIRERAQW